MQLTAIVTFFFAYIAAVQAVPVEIPAGAIAGSVLERRQGTPDVHGFIEDVKDAAAHRLGLASPAVPAVPAVPGSPNVPVKRGIFAAALGSVNGAVGHIKGKARPVQPPAGFITPLKRAESLSGTDETPFDLDAFYKDPTSNASAPPLPPSPDVPKLGVDVPKLPGKRENVEGVTEAVNDNALEQDLITVPKAQDLSELPPSPVRRQDDAEEAEY
ncbi:hypothetical protein BKA70DRAFT_1418571 [Coprinopsis sp. MPI-PUGE-AT-0042]|nr:hypothetical protein BKA70DRAFT_1418571 [Coprinopsis sp. MPI-PUGE-AT-0042]